MKPLPPIKVVLLFYRKSNQLISIKLVHSVKRRINLPVLYQPNLTDFRTTINNNLYSNRSVEEFAKLCNTSVSTFKRKFKELYSESPKKYFSKMKMKRASQNDL
jgi:AraC-like DNA-binding protein